MSTGRYSRRRRTPAQKRADDRADQLATFLGRGLRESRASQAATQRQASDEAGLAQATWSELERGQGANMSLRVWVRATQATDSDLRAYLERGSMATAPRDAVHLRHQELVARTARGGGWMTEPEAVLEAGGDRSQVADLLLRRSREAALVEIWDWLADVGAAFRSWDRKLGRLAASSDDAVAGCWVLRATRRNRALVSEHPALFAARFHGSGTAWLAALHDPSRPMPTEPALLWVTVRADRLYPARLDGGATLSPPVLRTATNAG